MPRTHALTHYTPSAAPSAPHTVHGRQPLNETAAASVADWYDTQATTAPHAAFNAPCRSLVPPVVDSAHIASATGCARPVRQGGMRLEAVHKQDRLVVHNYGHGGAGWTLAPGVVEESLRLFDKARAGSLGAAPITVLGGGVIGLWTALALAQRPTAPPITIVAAAWEELTSHNAGGLLAPVSLQDSPDAKLRTQKLGHRALRVWEQIANGELTWARGGARQMPVFVGLDTDSGLDNYVRAGLLPAPRPVDVAFSAERAHAMRVYDTLFIDVRTMMQNLHAALDGLGVRRVTAQVRNLDELDADVVFNCAGLGAKALCDDPGMQAVRGHLLRLCDQPPSHARDYMVYTHIDAVADVRSGDTRDAAACPPGYLYYMPKGEGVLGGTFVTGEESPEADARAFAGIMARAQGFFRSYRVRRLRRRGEGD